jgi:hypothetical protein
MRPKIAKNIILVITCILFGSCDDRSSRTIDELSVCRISFGPYCIASELADFRLNIQELDASPVAGSAILLVAHSREDSMKSFAALISELETPDPLKAVAECKFLDVQLDDCDLANLPSVTYRYADEFKGQPNLVMEKGIRVTSLRRRGLEPDIAKTIAFPCQFMSDGRNRCAASLPTCKSGPDWVGCRIN